MRSHPVSTMLIALLLFIAAPVFVLAQDPARAPARGTTAIVAYVVAEFDEESNIVGLVLEEQQGGLFHVVLDQKGRMLGSELDGEWVDVSGTVSERDGEGWITVTSFTLANQREEEDQWIEEEEVEDWNDPVEPSDLDEETAEGWEEDTWEEDEAAGDWEEEEQDEQLPEGDDTPADDPDLF